MLSISFWFWIIIAVVLVVLTRFVLRGPLLWSGVSAAVVAGIVYLAHELAWEYQFIMFSVLSIVLIALWRRYAGKTPARASS